MDALIPTKFNIMTVPDIPTLPDEAQKDLIFEGR